MIHPHSHVHHPHPHTHPHSRTRKTTSSTTSNSTPSSTTSQPSLSLKLPSLTTLSSLTSQYHFSAFQESIINSTYSEIEQNLDNSIINDDMKDLIVYVLNFYVNKFTRNNSERIIMFYKNGINRYFHREHDVSVLSTLLTQYIITNIYQFGLFVECWESFNDYVMMYYINLDDRDESTIIVPRNTNGTSTSPTSTPTSTSTVDDILNFSFEQNLNEVINKTYSPSPTITHDVKILTSPSSLPLPRDENNSECKLCFDESNYVCSKCGYPLCSSCVDRIKHSTGKCPCCQDYPLMLNIVSNFK